MDWRELLKRYMARVIDIEGVDFIDYLAHTTPDLSAEDRAELGKISAEVREEYDL